MTSENGADSGCQCPCPAPTGCYTICHASNTCTLLDRLPTPTEHRRLSEAVGWSHAFAWETMPASLAGSLAGVVAVDGSQVIGMGRLVGDGVKYFYVQDLAVLPAYQGRGIGRALLHRLLDYVNRTAPATAFVGLFATDGAVSLYQRGGFTAGDMAGMFRLVAPGIG